MGILRARRIVPHIRGCFASIARCSLMPSFLNKITQPARNQQKYSKGDNHDDHVLENAQHTQD
jgi:hypothetical protein